MSSPSLTLIMRLTELNRNCATFTHTNQQGVESTLTIPVEFWDHIGNPSTIENAMSTYTN